MSQLWLMERLARMGNKTHAVGFRLGIVRDWQTKWFASDKNEYRSLVLEDLRIRNEISNIYSDAGISKIEIARNSNEVEVTVNTSRPGIVIGRGGQKIEEMRKSLEKSLNRKVKLNVQEIRQAELDATLVARNLAEQLERRVALRRAIRQATGRTMQSGAKGIKIICSGRLGGAEIARTDKAIEGRVPLHTIRADIDFSVAHALTDFGVIGVKVWIYLGDILPKQKEQVEDIEPIEVTVKTTDDTDQDATTKEG